MMTKRVAIIGGGPAGCVCALYALKNKNIEVTIFDNKPLMTSILPTGHGRCNFTYAEFDFKQLVQYYPRGEKFLYSVFSQFGVADSIELFEKLGVETYMQPDMRYFPISNSSKTVQKAFVNKLCECKNFKFEQKNIENLTDLLDVYDYIVVATGANNRILKQIADLKQPVVPFKQALTPLKVQETYLYQLPGVTLKNVSVKIDNQLLKDDILITHTTLSGPLIYKISSYMAFCDFPYKLTLNFSDFKDEVEFYKYFDNLVMQNNNKNCLNVLSYIVPHSFAELLLSLLNIDRNVKCNSLNKSLKQQIVKKLFAFEINVIGTKKQGETVMAGGVNTDFINPKTMQSKIMPNICFAGEILNVDGLCGGFNLQNCWSTGAICGKFLANSD